MKRRKYPMRLVLTPTLAVLLSAAYGGTGASQPHGTIDVGAIPPYPLRQQELQRQRKESLNGAPRGLVAVATAAGITITVAPAFANKILPFIAALAARGYKPRKIHCYASSNHVPNSLHYTGHACDFDQTGWGKTARPMYHVGALVLQYGLRDGAEFRDWGHIDDGPHLMGRSLAERRKQRKAK